MDAYRADRSAIPFEVTMKISCVINIVRPMQFGRFAKYQNNYLAGLVILHSLSPIIPVYLIRL
jgi:hypothetical protein